MSAPASGNYSGAFLRAAFKRRYLVEFAFYVGGIMERSQSQSTSFAIILLSLLLGPASPLLAVAAGAGLLLRQSQVEEDVSAALAEAARRAMDELGSGSRALPSVEKWLDRHIDDLPAYLDRLDRFEDESRRERALVARINQAGSADALSGEDRAFLRRRGFKKLTPPLVPSHPLPPRSRLGNWHFSELDRALWRDIGRRTGGRGKLWRRIFGFRARPLT